ncbi:hypothetical protein FQZ97_601010 [compost metagenome]
MGFHAVSVRAARSTVPSMTFLPSSATNAAWRGARTGWPVSAKFQTSSLGGRFTLISVKRRPALWRPEAFSTSSVAWISASVSGFSGLGTRSTTKVLSRLDWNTWFTKSCGT